MFRVLCRKFSSKSPEFYAAALKKHQLFSMIDAEGNVFNEANGNPYFDVASPTKELQFWRNLRKNNVRINEDYPYSADKPIVFHSYISRNVSILRDEHVIVDDDVKDAKTKHGVLIYGCNLAIPFIPKYLSINVDSKYLYFPLMNTHLGGLGKLNQSLETYFKQFVSANSKSERSGYMFHFINSDYDMESVELSGIHSHVDYSCFFVIHYSCLDYQPTVD